MVVFNDDLNPFFITVEYEMTLPFSFKIDWNVAAIAQKENSFGYIVQYVKMVGKKENITVPYYEAWKVENGHTNRKENYDDRFFCYVPVNYYTKIYWIDESDDLFESVSQWKPCLRFFAGDLPAEIASDFPYLSKREPIFERIFRYPATMPIYENNS